MLADALHAPGPADPAAMDDFGRLVGDWRLHWSGLAPDGTWHHATGELHVGWVLGGRAVQDVWIVPGRGQPGAGMPPLAFHGTTVRFLHPDGDRWLSTWMEPVNGRVRRFTGRAHGADVELLSDDEEPWLRWRITDVRADSFTWSAETSRDRGRTWVHDELMRAERLAQALSPCLECGPDLPAGSRREPASGGGQAAPSRGSPRACEG